MSSRFCLSPRRTASYGNMQSRWAVSRARGERFELSCCLPVIITLPLTIGASLLQRSIIGTTTGFLRWKVSLPNP